MEKGLRLAVVAFRDHKDGYVTKDFDGFTTNVDAIVANLSTLRADGGDDAPEAITAALDKALNLKWREDAVKIAVVITDAPPHGIGERDDHYPNGDPDGMLAPNFCMNDVNFPEGKDPVVVAKAMSKLGIALVFVDES